jgi:phage terminase large subunit-like protein
MAILSRAERNIQWIEAYLRVPEGRDVGKPVRLRDWQKNELRKIYDNPAGTRRAILSFGRKNGKTAFAAFVTALHLCGPEAKRNSQLFSAAQSRAQAAVLFELAAKMVRMNEDLSAEVDIKDSRKELVCRELGVVYRALSADATTAFGLSPSLIIHDETGQVRGPRSPLYEALETAVGAQDDPLSIVISTQAPNDGDLLSLLIDAALTKADPRVVISLYTTPVEEEDPFSERAVRAANPAFGDFQSAKETMQMASEARNMVSREPEYRNYVLNQRVEVNSPFITRSVWSKCGGELLPSFAGMKVYAGLDLSSANDLTAFVMVAQVGNVWHVKPTFWLPSQGLAEKARAEHQPYDIWHDQGFLETTPGPTVDYEFIAEYIWGQSSKVDLQRVAFDRWGYRILSPHLKRAGFREDQLTGDDALFQEFGQGMQSMSPALREVETLILNQRLVHGNNPVLTMCAANTKVIRDPAGNRKLDKSNPLAKIDGVIAMIMGLMVGVMDVGRESEPSFWEKMI